MPAAIPVPKIVRELTKEFYLKGFKLYLVGGSVRDYLMGVKSKDYDLATDASPEQVIDVLNHTSYTFKSVGKAFGVIIASDNTQDVEIATFREDIGIGRRPDSVKFSTIDIDVMRRDLTINALFYDIQRREIVDYVGGVSDIKNRIVRTVGDAEQRFNEDRLRVLRAVRFAARFGTELDPKTYDAIASNPTLEGVSSERIFDEFARSVSSAHSVTHYLDMLTRLGLLRYVFPNLTLGRMRIESKNLAMITALLLSSNPRSIIVNALLRLKWPSSIVRDIKFLMELHTLTPATVFQTWNAKQRVGLSPDEIMMFATVEPACRTNPCIPVFLNSYAPITLGSTLIKEGLTGKKIGLEIIRRESQLFSNLLMRSV